MSESDLHNQNAAVFLKVTFYIVNVLIIWRLIQFLIMYVYYSTVAIIGNQID